MPCRNIERWTLIVILDNIFFFLLLLIIFSSSSFLLEWSFCWAAWCLWWFSFCSLQSNYKCNCQPFFFLSSDIPLFALMSHVQSLSVFEIEMRSTVWCVHWTTNDQRPTTIPKIFISRLWNDAWWTTWTRTIDKSVADVYYCHSQYKIWIPIPSEMMANIKWIFTQLEWLNEIYFVFLKKVFSFLTFNKNFTLNWRLRIYSLFGGESY